MEYLIHRTVTPPSLNGEWDSPIWSQANTGELTFFVPRSSAHHPRVQFRLLYNDAGLYLIFRVEDRYVRSVVTKFNGHVCRDSCTEFFVQPNGSGPYFNFEVNCGGHMLCYYIDPNRPTKDFFEHAKLTPEDGAAVGIYHSMPAIVDPEITEPTVWFNQLHIPFSLLEKYTGPLGSPAGQVWRANLYKCADATSHPHWATWAPIEGASFHQVPYFAPLRFE
ncbi:MAG TPA: carbohydrate-binding family 9-like protein [Armatimonadota bacterium]|jgi:hypothetical protein